LAIKKPKKIWNGIRSKKFPSELIFLFSGKVQYLYLGRSVKQDFYKLQLMKTLLFLFLGCFLSLKVGASEFLPAMMVNSRGDTLHGFVKHPVKSNAKFIRYKTTPETKAVKYRGDQFIKIIYESAHGPIV
jgi:hypothetical protein